MALGLAWFARKLLFIVGLLGSLACYEDPNRMPLEGKWRCQAGDYPYWARPDLDDSTWAHCRVPTDAKNQDLGRNGGWIWYRTSYEITQTFPRPMALELGVISDADETFVDGVRVGQTGDFPPWEQTAFHLRRAYLLADEFLRPGKHVIAVRVYKMGGPGTGIVSGPVGLSQLSLALRAASLHRFLRSDLLVAAAAVTLIVGLYYSFVALFRRRDQPFQIFSALSFFVAFYVFAASFRWMDLLVQPATYMRLGLMASIGSAHFLLWFIRSSMRKRFSSWDALSLLFAAGFSGMIALAPNYGTVHLVYAGWFPFLLALLSYSGWVLIRHSMYQKRAINWAISIPFLLLALAVVHDVWVTLFDVGAYLWNPFGFMVLVLGLSLFLAVDYSGALADRSHKEALERERVELIDQTKKDSLTKLWNRESFDEKLPHELEVALGTGAALCLGLVEIDHLSVYKDSFGETAADRVLGELAWVVRETMAPGDMASRYRQDTLALLFPNTNDEDAITSCRKIRHLVESFPFEHPSGENRFPITVSIGVSTLSDQTCTPQQLLESAEQALKRAKAISNTVFCSTFTPRDPGRGLGREAPRFRVLRGEQNPR